MRWNLWSYLVSREMKFLLAWAMYLRWFYYCSARPWKALLRLLMVEYSILFHSSASCSINCGLMVAFPRARVSSSLMFSGLVLAHLFLIYSLSFVCSMSYSCFFFYCYASWEFQAYCFFFMASTSSSLDWRNHSRFYLSPLPSIYSQHLKEVTSSDPNWVPKRENHYFSLFLFFYLKWLFMTRAAPFSPSLSCSG